MMNSNIPIVKEKVWDWKANENIFLTAVELTALLHSTYTYFVKLLLNTNISIVNIKHSSMKPIPWNNASLLLKAQILIHMNHMCFTSKMFQFAFFTPWSLLYYNNCIICSKWHITRLSLKGTSFLSSSIGIKADNDPQH